MIDFMVILYYNKTEKYVVKIITDLLTGAINLGEKYSKYYVEEYDNFHDYLYT